MSKLAPVAPIKELGRELLPEVAQDRALQGLVDLLPRT